MVQKLRGRINIPEATIDGHLVDHGTPPTPNTAAGISRANYSRPPERLVFTFVNAVLSMTAANDFGGLEICALPNANLVLMGAKINVTAVMAGFASNVGTALDMALGTVTTASAAFSNAGEMDLIPKIDGTGAGTTATVAGRGTTTEANKWVAAGASNKVFLNASSPVTSGTGTLTINGTVELLVQYHH